MYNNPSHIFPIVEKFFDHPIYNFLKNNVYLLDNFSLTNWAFNFSKFYISCGLVVSIYILSPMIIINNIYNLFSKKELLVVKLFFYS